MKIMICVVLFSVCAWAQAEEWLEAPNRDGGSIILTHTQCSDEFPNAKRMMTIMSGGMTIHGCWAYQTGRVKVVYFDGSTYLYSPENFRVRSGDGDDRRRDLLSYPKYK